MVVCEQVTDRARDFIFVCEETHNQINLKCRFGPKRGI